MSYCVRYIGFVLACGQPRWVESTQALESSMVSNLGFTTFKFGTLGLQFLHLKMRMMVMTPLRWPLL